MKKYVEQIVIAKPNWCVPAALEMVLKHFGIEAYSQEIIAEQFEIVPATDNMNHSKWGAQINNGTINSFFTANQLALYEKYIPITHFYDEYSMVEIVRELLQKNTSIICGYNYTRLFGKGEDTFQHVSIIVELLAYDEEIRLLDPGPREAGYKTVKTVDLFYAIRAAQDGLWCIEEQKADTLATILN